MRQLLFRVQIKESRALHWHPVVLLPVVDEVPQNNEGLLVHGQHAFRVEFFLVIRSVLVRRCLFAILMWPKNNFGPRLVADPKSEVRFWILFWVRIGGQNKSGNVRAEGRSKRMRKKNKTENCA